MHEFVKGYSADPDLHPHADVEKKAGIPAWAALIVDLIQRTQPILLAGDRSRNSRKVRRAAQFDRGILSHRRAGTNRCPNPQEIRDRGTDKRGTEMGPGLRGPQKSQRAFGEQGSCGGSRIEYSRGWVRTMSLHPMPRQAEASTQAAMDSDYSSDCVG